MAGIRLNHIYKRYGKSKQTIVNDFHLDIKEGEFLVLVGPSGCGKSTTLRMIAGLEDITEGELYVGDRLINDLQPKDRDMAMVFQNYALYPNMTVFENIAFALRLRKQPKHAIELMVKKAAQALELEPYLNRKPRMLSGGQRQRTALGRAMVREPKVFLMDEPLSNLDAKLRVQMRSEILRIHKQLKVTTIYVTHDQIEAMTMGDRIVVMKDGVIQQADTPENIYALPNNRFVASFIGSPPMNFIEGRLETAPDGSLTFHTSRFAWSIPEVQARMLQHHRQGHRLVQIGLRPEHLIFSPASQKGAELSSVMQAIPGTYQFSELMGADRYLHIDIGQSRMLVARTLPEHMPREDEPIVLYADMSHALYFHPDTGERWRMDEEVIRQQKASNQAVLVEG
ncbi:sn-glycerol-3-phosphate ABC transporter ATP-binding protein UgpC [Paenibacillus sp. H1-7]|uniref:ABC transporter ATP-binding protein n=1 Tax=Paenibacillus sp. H1-7 TaxID=2282849 RepID=UPI001EF91D36|nr:sn-glycerol-3-phosphate ABC transporter ATP-binding protein UgpC [Paenibacillus sp. H1-7]ULL18901.1 sn-glycerol-3-phosphate ABC transporter ATP-binding protein UgpC [Paenibacillus sp. H1-7]